MGEFFKPWRRKIGVLTLVVACLFMAGWVRSLSVKDVIVLPKRNGNSTSDFLWSVDSHVAWINDPGLFVVSSYLKWETHSNVQKLWSDLDGPHISWKWRRCGFAAIEYRSCFGRGAAWLIPYWSIVVPMTTLSAYLLLSKPRKSNQKKTPEPTVNEGA